MKNELLNLIGENERILYEGKPDLKCYIFETVFNPLLPFALLWAAIDLGIFGTVIFDMGGEEKSLLFFLVPFLLLHMMPVWIYISGIAFMLLRYRNTNYIVTDKAIYTSGGIFNKQINNKSFGELSHIHVHRGIFDQLFGVGDIIANSSQHSENGPAAVAINSISDYDEVYKLIKKVQEDVYTDIMYPNDLRPPENHGYKTEYKG